MNTGPFYKDIGKWLDIAREGDRVDNISALAWGAVLLGIVVAVFLL